VSPLYLTQFGFCCVHSIWSHQNLVWSSGMPSAHKRKVNTVPNCKRISVAMHDSWRRPRILYVIHVWTPRSQPALQWKHCSAALVRNFWRISSLAFANILNMWTQQMFNVTTSNHFLLVAWPLPTTHFASILTTVNCSLYTYYC